MKNPTLACLLVFGLLNAGYAQPSKLNANFTSSSSQPSETKLKAWFKKQPTIQKKVAAIANSATVVAMAGTDVPGDLKDALSSGKAAVPVSFNTCCTLERCDSLPTILHVENSSQLEDAMAAMVWPWMLLQRAKRSSLDLSTPVKSGDQILRMSLKDFKNTPLELHAALLPGGGITLMLKSNTDPAAFFEKERRTVLSRQASE